MKKAIGITFMLLIVLSFQGVAQLYEEQQPEAVVTQVQTVDSLLSLHIAYNQAFPVFPGYRIQLLMESGNHALLEAEELTAEFLEKYPETRTYITFREPYYRVRIGDFRTRLEAEHFLSQLTRKYPNAWVIQENISFPSLSHYPKTENYE